MSIKIKICGLRDEAAIAAVNNVKADYAGFVFYPKSPRHIEPLKAAALKSVLDKNIKSVSVLVDPDDRLVDEIMATLSPDYLQLHGSESPARIAEIKNRYPDLRIIKAIAIRNSDDVARATHYIAADMLLFDSSPATLPGGNGISFDWTMLKGKNFQLPWMLSGGLNEANVADAIMKSGARMVDVSSGVESLPGVKDAGLIDGFVKAAKST